MSDPHNAFLDGLGGLPAFVEAAGAIGIMIGAAFATWFGFVRNARERRQIRDPYGGGTEVYLDGPLGQALTSLRTIAEALQRLVAVAPDLGRLRQDLMDELAKNRQYARNDLQGTAQGLEKDRDVLDERVRELDRQGASHEARIANLESRRRSP